MRGLSGRWWQRLVPGPSSALEDASLRFLFVIAVVVVGGMILAAICGEPPATDSGAGTGQPAATSMTASNGS